MKIGIRFRHVRVLSGDENSALAGYEKEPP
jgi:hypothetical protein